MSRYLVQDICGLHNMYVKCFTCETWEDVVQKIIDKSFGDNEDNIDENVVEKIKKHLLETKKNLEKFGVGAFDTARVLGWDFEVCCTITDLTFKFPKDYESHQDCVNPRFH